MTALMAARTWSRATPDLGLVSRAAAALARLLTLPVTLPFLAAATRFRRAVSTISDMVELTGASGYA